VSEAGWCPICHVRLGVYIPSGGDGSLLVMRKHKRLTSAFGGYLVWCEGTGKVACDENLESVAALRREEER